MIPKKQKMFHMYLNPFQGLRGPRSLGPLRAQAPWLSRSQDPFKIGPLSFLQGFSYNFLGPKTKTESGGGARASGGPGRGPLYSVNIFSLDYKKKWGEKKENRLSIIPKNKRCFYICLNPLGYYRGLGGPGIEGPCGARAPWHFGSQRLSHKWGGGVIVATGS